MGITLSSIIEHIQRMAATLQTIFEHNKNQPDVPVHVYVVLSNSKLSIKFSHILFLFSETFKMTLKITKLRYTSLMKRAKLCPQVPAKVPSARSATRPSLLMELDTSATTVKFDPVLDVGGECQPKVARYSMVIYHMFTV